MAPVMSIRCITVPPRMNPSGFESFGRTTWTVSAVESCQRLGFNRSLFACRPHRTSVSGLRHAQLAAIEIQRDAVRAQELVADDTANLKAEQHARRLKVEHHHCEVL